MDASTAMAGGLLLLGVASLAGIPLAAAIIPDGAARLELLAWTGVICALLAIPAARLDVSAWIGRSAAPFAAPGQPVLVLAIVGVAALVQALAFRGMPQFPDSFAEMFQARMLAAGRLWLESPARPDLLRIANVVDDGGRWFSQYPTGNPAVLALGIRAGVTWLPAALVALAVATGIRALARECAGEGAAALALLLALASPTLVLSTAAGMSQATAAALGAWVLALALRARRYAAGVAEGVAAAAVRPARHPSGVAAAVGAGILAGAMAAVRPLDALVLSLVAFGAVLGTSWHRVAPALLFLVGALVGVTPLLVVNWATTGAALRFGYSVLWGAGTLPGFGMRGWGVPFGPGDGLRNTLTDLGGLDLALLEWPVPVLLVLAALVMLRRPLPVPQRVLAAYVLIHVAAYFAYWHHDFFYGPRFLLPLVPALLVLLADGLVHLARVARPQRGWLAGPLRYVRELLFLQVAAAAILVAWPRMADAGRLDIAAAAAIRDAAETLGRPRAALLVDDGWGSRLFGEMWRLGVSAPAADRFYSAADACRLEWSIQRIDREGQRGPAAEAELARLLAGATPGVPIGRYPAPRLRIPAGPLQPECAEELAYDRERQRAPFAPLLWLNDVDGRGVVFWRDPGPARLASLLAEAQRPVYRVRVSRRVDGGFRVGFEPLLTAGPLRVH